jgi:hypothetical protein
MVNKSSGLSSHPLPPIVRGKHHQAPSFVTSENLLREARRQKTIPDLAVPDVCILDPDGDILRHLRARGLAEPFEAWACYHRKISPPARAGESSELLAAL